MPPHALTLWSSALVAQWIEHGSPKAGVGGSIPLWGTLVLSRDIVDNSVATWWTNRCLGFYVSEAPVFCF